MCVAPGRRGMRWEARAVLAVRAVLQVRAMRRRRCAVLRVLAELGLGVVWRECRSLLRLCCTGSGISAHCLQLAKWSVTGCGWWCIPRLRTAVVVLR